MSPYNPDLLLKFWNSIESIQSYSSGKSDPLKKKSKNWIKIMGFTFPDFKSSFSHLKCFLWAKKRCEPLCLCSGLIARIRKTRNLLNPDRKPRFRIIQIRIWLNLIRGDTSFKKKKQHKNQQKSTNFHKNIDKLKFIHKGVFDKMTQNMWFFAKNTFFLCENQCNYERYLCFQTLDFLDHQNK